MTRSLRSALALVLALGIASPPVLACCDDFWSCAGAVATGGLSCVVEAALNALRTLIRTVEGSRSQTSKDYLGGLQATFDEMKSELARLEGEIRTAMQEIEQARTEADKIVKEDADTNRQALTKAKLRAETNAGTTLKSPSTGIKGTVAQESGVRAALLPATPTPTKASAGGLVQVSFGAEIAALTHLVSDESLATLRHRIEQLKQRKEVLVAAILKTEVEMVGIQAQASQNARAAFQDEFLKPIDDLIASLNAALRNPLNAPAAVDAALRLLNGALNGFHTRADPLADAAAQAADRAVARKIPPAQEMQKLAAEAKKTLAAIRKAVAYRAAYERQAVVKDLGALLVPTPSAVSKATRLRASSALGESSKRSYTRFVELKPQFQRVSEARMTVDVSPFRQKLAGDFDGFYRGKSPADAKKKHVELLAEARRRFASDPKTLTAVEKMLTDEARARGVPP